MHSDSAISVRKFNVKPKAYKAMNVAITAIGSVSPVMIVLRQLCRKRKTMSTVRIPPSTIVDFTRLTARSAVSAVELATRISTSAGRRFFSASRAAMMPRPVSTMFASCDFWTSIVIDGRPLIREIEVSSFSPSITSATCDR